MNMIIHQTVAPYLNSFFPTVVIEDFKIEFFIVLVKENDLAPIASLDDMVRMTGDNNSSNSSHYF